MLDIPSPAATGDPLPPLWHWIYLLERRPQSELGPDGHPTRGIPQPPGPGRLRMFAGGRVTTHRELRFAEPATRRTSVLRSVEKRGRSGPLTFVTVHTEVVQAGALAITEDQNTVYRKRGTLSTGIAAPVGSEIDVQTARRASGDLEVDVDEVMLFRFSALTYNAHRIHYEREYAPGEGYPGLVIHGPLQALLMGEALRRAGVSMLGREYGYRLMAPACGAQRLAVTVWSDEGGVEAEVVDQAGTATAKSKLTGRVRVADAVAASAAFPLRPQ